MNKARYFKLNALTNKQKDNVIIQEVGMRSLTSVDIMVMHVTQ